MNISGWQLSIAFDQIVYIQMRVNHLLNEVKKNFFNIEQAVRELEWSVQNEVKSKDQYCEALSDLLLYLERISKLEIELEEITSVHFLAYSSILLSEEMVLNFQRLNSDAAIVLNLIEQKMTAA